MSKNIEADIQTLAKHLLLAAAVREIDDGQAGGYPSERKSRREAAIRQYMEHLPEVREILLRGKS